MEEYHHSSISAVRFVFHHMGAVMHYYTHNLSFTIVYVRVGDCVWFGEGRRCEVGVELWQAFSHICRPINSLHMFISNLISL